MNKYICVRELIFCLFRDVSLGRLCSNSSTASATTTSKNLTQHPGVVTLHVNAFHFSTTARWVTSPTWGPPPPCKQALRRALTEFQKVRYFKTCMHVGYWALPWMARLTARAFSAHYSSEAHFSMVNSNDGIKIEASINYDMDTWESWMPAISGRSIKN